MNILRFVVLLTLSALFGVLAARGALAGDAVALKSYYEDATGQKVFSEVKEAEFVAYEGVFSRGYSDATFWFRLRIDPSAIASIHSGPSADKLVLRIRPPYLREVEFFDPAFDQGRRRLTGDLYPSSKDEYRSWNLAFVMPVGAEPRDVFVRMKTSSSTLINFEAFSFDEIVMVDFRQSAFFALFIFFVSFAIICAAIISIFSKMELSNYFFLSQVSTLIWALTTFGLARCFIPFENFNNVLFMTLSVVAATFLAELFHFKFLKEMGSAKGLQWAQLLLMAVPVVAFLLIISGDIRLAMKLNIIAALIFTTLSSLGSWFLRPLSERDGISHDIPKWAVVLVYSLIFIFTMSTLLPQLGAVKAAEFAVYSVASSSFGSSILFTTVLLYEFYQIKKREQRLRTDLAHQSDLLHFEKMSREDQGALLAMLSHELKTPLAGIQMSLATGALNAEKVQRINKAIRDMVAVIERCSTVNRIDDGALVAATSPVAFTGYVGEMISLRANPQNITYCFDEEIVFCVDRQLLDVILTNLIDNAQKYSIEQSIVKLESRRLKNGGLEGLEVMVSSEPRADLWPAADQLFKKYYRAEGAHRVGGSGLGLYLVHKVTEALGGSITYAPTDTHVRFRLWLPV